MVVNFAQRTSRSPVEFHVTFTGSWLLVHAQWETVAVAPTRCLLQTLFNCPKKLNLQKW